MRKPFLFILLMLSIFVSSCAQKSLLQSGPMLGYAEMREVKLWVQTKSAAEVKIAYWEKGTKDKKHFTDSVMTRSENAFATHLLANQVLPSKIYDYELYINDQPVKFDYPTSFQSQKLWEWRGAPPEFKLALGSCNYINEVEYDRPGNSYGGEYDIFKTIAEQKPDVMLWLGDNTYLREVDWFSKTGIQHRYTHTRSIPEIQPLLSNVHHYAVWDDHDFGPNDSDGSFIHKDKTKAAFDLFWANPSSGLPEQLDKGTTSYARWNDVDLFLLDNRYFRTPNRQKTGKRTMLGEEQLEWIISALVSSRATFKLVAMGNQVLTTAEVYETYANLYPEERAYLLMRIGQEKIRNVVFLSGDRHHTELSKIVNFNGNVVYDLTVSPLTSGTGSERKEYNKNRVENTLVLDRNFGLLTFTGDYKKRKMLIQIMDTEGKELWQYEIVKQ